MQHSHSIQIVIADDHELVRDGIRARLENEHDLALVGEATNGEEAVRLVANLQPDLILLDINMPKLGGLEAASRIRQKSSDCRILMLSIYDNHEYVHQARALGTNGYLLKDVTQDEMVLAIRTAAVGGFYISKSLDSAVVSETASVSTDSNAYKLTERELQILAAIAAGQLNKQIAGDLDISVRTVESHRSAIRQKTGGGNAAMLAKIAQELGLGD